MAYREIWTEPLPQQLKITREKGYIKVDEYYQTSTRGIYAVGDIIGPPWLAHVATYQAVQAVNGMFEASKPKAVKVFPSCTYCQPQVASIGMSEGVLKEKGIAYKVGKFPFSASGKAVAVGEPEGFIKLLVCQRSGEILGAHITGSNASELIAEFGLAIELEATWKEIHETLHAHPSFSEAIMESAGAVNDESIHI